MGEAAFWWLAQAHCNIQRPDRQISRLKRGGFWNHNPHDQLLAITPAERLKAQLRQQ